MTYLLLKLVHVVAVILFLGNITTGIFWKAHADRMADPRIIAHALAGIIRSDRFFTIPGVVAIIVAGVAAALVGGYPILGTGWILWAIILFTVSGLAFMFQVAPLQVRLLEVASANEFDQERYRALSRRWGFWGFISLITPLAALVLMVLKRPF